MSNFICPTCGFTNIDCSKAGYKTDREIELEKQLEIAVKALEEYTTFCRHPAEEALEKIKEIK